VFFGRHRRSPVDAASRRRDMLQVRNGGRRPCSAVDRAHCRRTAENTRGADSFLGMRRHPNTGNITYSSHPNDSLYSTREYKRFKFFQHFLW